MLFLLFQLGRDRYALEARRALEVLPLLPLTKIPLAPRGVAGLFNYRGQPVLAVDLCELLTGQPARELLSTRLIIIRLPHSSGQLRCLGLIAERATSLLRREPQDFINPGDESERPPFLGPVAMDSLGVIQLLNPDQLLPENTRPLLEAQTLAPRHEAD